MFLRGKIIIKNIFTQVWLHGWYFNILANKKSEFMSMILIGCQCNSRSVMVSSDVDSHLWLNGRHIKENPC